MAERGTKYERVFQGRSYDDAWPKKATEFITWIQSHLRAVSAEFRKEVEILFEADESAVEIDIYYYRPETDGELASGEGQRIAEIREHEIQERLLLAQLQAKYGAK